MKSLIEYLGFTKSEIRVIIFVVSVLVIGFCIKYYTEVINNPSSVEYDYTGSDKEFIRLSRIQPDSSADINTGGERKPIESININSASKYELVKLDGIGEELAERIIVFRKDKGGFKRKTDLMKVKGIGKIKFGKIKKFISVK